MIRNRHENEIDCENVSLENEEKIHSCKSQTDWYCECRRTTETQTHIYSTEKHLENWFDNKRGSIDKVLNIKCGKYARIVCHHPLSQHSIGGTVATATAAAAASDRPTAAAADCTTVMVWESQGEAVDFYPSNECWALSHAFASQCMVWWLV